MSTKPLRIEPLSQRLPRILAYPATGAMLGMLAALSVLRLLNHLPSLLGLLFEVAFWVIGFKLAVEALVNTAHGRFEPLGGQDLMATDGEAVQQILLMVGVSLAIGVVAFFFGPVPALALLVLALLLVPAAVILLAVDQSLVNAINPLAWGPLIGRLGVTYVGAVAVLVALMVLAQVLQILLLWALPGTVGTLPGSFISLYVLVAGYHLLGYVIHQHHQALGLDITPAVARATFANPLEDEAMEDAEALAADGQHAAAADRLQDLFRGRGASDPVHDRYHRLVIAAGDAPRLVKHGREYISSLLATDKDKRALAVAMETLAQVPDFRPELPGDIGRLVAQAAKSGQGQLAVSLAEGFEQRFPGHEATPQLVLQVAPVMADRLGREQAAQQRLQACLQHHRGHVLEPALLAALADVDRLLAITGGVRSG